VAKIAISLLVHW